jgi:hypothetical protein
MDWGEALKVGTVGLASLGGGGAIVVAASNYVGRIWADRYLRRQQSESAQALERLRGEVESGLKRLDVALSHQKFMMQSVAELEMKALNDCWQAARDCVTRLNATRPADSGTEVETLNANYRSLVDAHNVLLETFGKHEPFLPDDIAETLRDMRTTANLEIDQVQNQAPFGELWWDEGTKNREKMHGLAALLKDLTRARWASLVRQNASLTGT